MYQRFCLILAVIFLFNSLPLPAAAQAIRSSHNTRRQRAARQAQFEANLEARINHTTYPYDNWKIEQAELQALLKEPDLSVLEKKFIELELQNLKAHIEFMNALQEDHIALGALNRQYNAWFEAIDTQKQALEKIAALRSFYQEAQSDHFIAAAVYALHRQQSVSVPQKPYSGLTLTREQREELLQQLLVEPTDAIHVNIPPVLQVDVNHANELTPSLLSQYEENKISLEDVVEYADPVDGYLAEVTPANIAQAATILFSMFYSYNNTPNLDPQTLENAVWLARRLKYRVMHQLHQAEQTATSANAVYWVEARGNLMLLSMQVENFLRTFDTPADLSARTSHDTQLEEYKLLKNDLAAYQKGVWPYHNVADSLTRELKSFYGSGIRQDSANFTLFASKLSYAIRFLLVSGKLGNISELLVMVNTDKDSFHGSNETFVSAIFAALFDSFISDPLSSDIQQAVRQLLWCAAAPKCTYNTTEKTNSVNVRTQALAVASMLRQIAKNGKLTTDQGETPVEIATFNKSLFNDEKFRTAMAAYTIDIYWPTQAWNVSKNNITRYGLQLDELQDFANYLANMYETFLPVKEPKTTIKKITGGIYEGCSIREIDTSRSVYLHGLYLTRMDSLTQSTSNRGYPCKENLRVKDSLYGDFTKMVVTDSKGDMHTITALNPYNRDRAIQDFVNTFFIEVATWYLWGAAWKALGYGWKALRATTLAGKAALQANNGVRLMRFNSKFAQIWKYSTNGWKTEMGLTNITKTGNKLVVEIHRPGYQGYVFEFGEEVLQGHSLKTLQGKLLLRRAVQRRAYAQYGSVAVSEATTQGVTTSTQLAKRTLSNELADEIVRPLTKAEQETVRQEKTIVDAVKQELADGTSFEVIPATTGDPVFLYRPINTPQPYINLSTGLPEQAIIDPITGNVTGQFSRQYAGTIVTPYFQNQAAYNIAAGLTTSPSGLFMKRVLANEFPLFGQLSGLSKFVFTLTALDQPAYYLYTKPYLENFANRQHEELSKETGLEQQGTEAEPKNLLGQIQELRTTMGETTGAAMMGTFYGINQLLHLVLPSGVTQARQSLFTATAHTVEEVDGSLSKALEDATGSSKITDIFPLPGQVLSLPFILAGDPTPTYSEAARAQYQLAAYRQRLSRALKKHNITQFKQDVDNMLQNAGPLFLELKKIYAPYLDATTEQKLDRAFSDYKQALQQAQNLAETDLQQAHEHVVQADQTLSEAELNILSPRIKQVKDDEANALIEQYQTAWKQQYGEVIFDQTMQERLSQIVHEHTESFKQLLIQTLQIPTIAQQTGKTQEAVSKDIGRQLTNTQNSFEQQLNLLSLTLQIQGTMQTADEFTNNLIQTYQIYLQEKDDIQLKRYTQVYKQNLKNLLVRQPNKVSKLQDQLTQESLTFHNSYIELLSKRITQSFDEQLKLGLPQQKAQLRSLFGLVLQDADLQELTRISTQLNQAQKQYTLAMLSANKTAVQTEQTLNDVILNIMLEYNSPITKHTQELQALEEQLYNRLTGLLRSAAHSTQRQQILTALMQYDTLPLFSGIMDPQIDPSLYHIEEAKITQLQQKRAALIVYYNQSLNALLSTETSGEKLFAGYQEIAQHLKESWQQAITDILYTSH